MSEKNIVICDKEVKYAEKLMENIMERNEFAVKVYVCSTWENVKILSQDRSIHILVVDETYAKRDCSEVNAEANFCADYRKLQKCVSGRKMCLQISVCRSDIIRDSRNIF